MRLVPQIANVVLDAIALCRNALLLCRCGESADTLLLAGWIWIAKLKVGTIDRSVRAARLIEMKVLKHLSESTDLSTGIIVPTTVCDISIALASRPFVSTDKRWHLVFALLPHPYVLGVVTATAALSDW